MREVTLDADEYIKFGPAVAHILGPANHDEMSGTFYARFLVKDTDASVLSAPGLPAVCPRH
ncbi:carbon starvation induced protein CsiD [Paraburkholderia sp. J63]|uniref:carbon starvation induced protein CsiD n=1 Tax=Paraburkholderia sp. J63 TaxID=2805434 RepID=UPI002ABE0F32|nr:carbon starvation induced protein CsiD [Paraburkholderia sp. J63]